MKITVKAIPQARRRKMMKEADNFKVCPPELAHGNRANKAFIAISGSHFGLKKTQFEIIKGLKSRHKTINISNYI